MRKKKSYGFEKDGQIWLHMHPDSDEEVYKLNTGSDLVAQIWRDHNVKPNDQYTLSTKGYSDQVWRGTPNLSLETALDLGNTHSSHYQAQIDQRGLPSRLPRHMYRFEGDKHVWTVDSRKSSKSLMSQYILDDNNTKVVSIEYKNSKSDEVDFSIGYRNPETQLWNDDTYHTKELTDAEKYGEGKADKYFQYQKDRVKGYEDFPGFEKSENIIASSHEKSMEEPEID